VIRIEEIGVRMALGAQTRQVVWLFLRRALIHLGCSLTLDPVRLKPDTTQVFDSNRLGASVVR